MSGDAAIESWLASMSESELIDQCFFWHDMALEHGRMYNAVKDENTKLRELAQRMFDVISSRNSWWDGTCKDTEHFACLMRELGIEVMK